MFITIKIDDFFFLTVEYVELLNYEMNVIGQEVGEEEIVLENQMMCRFTLDPLVQYNTLHLFLPVHLILFK